jgi:hypothetical protein
MTTSPAGVEFLLVSEHTALLVYSLFDCVIPERNMEAPLNVTVAVKHLAHHQPVACHQGSLPQEQLIGRQRDKVAGKNYVQFKGHIIFVFVFFFVVFCLFC